jgi:hypothetical protein
MAAMPSPRPTLVLEVLTPCAELGDRYVVHPKQKILVGRTRVSDLVFDHPTVTSRHAWIWFENGQWMIRDAGSTAGTYIDDDAVPYSAEAPLPPGSKLRLGGFDLHVTEGAPDLEPSIGPGPYPRYGGEAATRSARDDEARPPRTPPFAGRFVLHELLGRGNQGVVHRAYDDERKDFVALKVFDPIADDALIAQFLSREKSQALRYGSWIQKHIAWGVVDRTPYLAMELALGERLSERLKLRPLTMKEAVEMVGKLGYGAGGSTKRAFAPEHQAGQHPLFAVRPFERCALGHLVRHASGRKAAVQPRPPGGVPGLRRAAHEERVRRLSRASAGRAGDRGVTSR